MRLALLVLLASPALADDIRRETLRVDETIDRACSREAGYAIGVHCDDDIVTLDDGIRRESLRVDEKIEREVGYAIGVHCDDDIVTLDDGIRRESLRVDETIEREVGYAIGVHCDDDIITAEMKSKNADTNVLVVTGKRAGKTMCRAGTDPNRVTYVYEFTVLPKRAPGRGAP